MRASERLSTQMGRILAHAEAATGALRNPAEDETSCPSSPSQAFLIGHPPSATCLKILPVLFVHDMMSWSCYFPKLLQVQGTPC